MKYRIKEEHKGIKFQFTPKSKIITAQNMTENEAKELLKDPTTAKYIEQVPEKEAEKPKVQSPFPEVNTDKAGNEGNDPDPAKANGNDPDPDPDPGKSKKGEPKPKTKETKEPEPKAEPKKAEKATKTGTQDKKQSGNTNTPDKK